MTEGLTKDLTDGEKLNLILQQRYILNRDRFYCHFSAV
jgi:hypothetical protein